MDISNKKRKAVVRDYPAKSIEDLARELELKPREVRAVLREAGKLAPRSFKKPLLIAAAVLAVAAAAYSVYSYISRPGPAKLAAVRGKLNVMLITIDTCRADHLGCYGFAQAKTPVIDGLASRGFRFGKTFALQPITLPSHSTIMTGTHPAYHGIEDNGNFKLPDKAVTLAEVLKDQGFATGAVISSFVLHRQYGLNQGLDYYDDRLSAGRRKDSAGFDEMPATDVSDRALQWIGENRDKRWFLWLHYYDPHADYLPPPQFARGAASAYDGEISYVDHEIGRVLDDLKEKHLRGNTLVVVTADHGESLGEHGEPTHGNFLYDAIMHVPLIFSLPGVLPPGESDELVSLLGVAPTVLDVLGVPAPSVMQGYSYLPLIFSQPGWTGRPIAMESDAPWFEHGWSPLKALRDPNFKYIRAPRPELYDLNQDPHELHNIYDQNKGRAETMDRILTKMRSEFAASSIGSGAKMEIDAQSRARLESLGYISSGAAEPAGPINSLPDPKDHIGVLAAMDQALATKKAGNVDGAIAQLTAIVQENPGDHRALNRLGVWNAEQKHYDLAEQYFTQLISSAPDFLEAYLNLGSLFDATGRYNQAELMAQAILKRDPSYAKAYGLLGTIHFNQRDYKGAIPFYVKAIQLYPSFDEAFANLGASYYNVGDKQKALKYFKAALQIMPSNPRYQKNVDDLTAEMQKDAGGHPASQQ